VFLFLSKLGLQERRFWNIPSKAALNGPFWGLLICRREQCAPYELVPRFGRGNNVAWGTLTLPFVLWLSALSRELLKNLAFGAGILTRIFRIYANWFCAVFVSEMPKFRLNLNVSAFWFTCVFQGVFIYYFLNYRR
jgi:hypothetical protein